MLASLSLPLLSERFGWQAALAGSSLVFAGLAAILWRRRPRWDDDREPGHRIRGGVLQSLRVIFSDPMLLALGVLGFFYSGFQMIIMTYTVTMLVTEVGWSLVAAGVVASAMQIGGAVGRIGWGVMADAFRNSTAVLILIGLLSLGLCWLVLGLDNRMPVMLVIGLFGGFGLTAVGWNGVYMAEVARLAPPGQVAAATGGSLVFCFAGAMSGPAGFALIHDWAGSYTSAFAFVMLTPLAGALAVGLASFRRRG
jgi:predicted MFS family arabinose efflux permease